MTDDQPTISVVTDISANIFAVFIVILIVLLALPHDEPPPAPPAKPVDALHDLVSVTRAPLTPTQLVDLLFARRRAADGISIDLFGDRIVIARPTAPPEEFPLPLDDRAKARALLKSTPAGAPIGLYVFDHRGYAAILQLLGGEPFREMSVPAALRATVDQRQDWREGFRVLIDRATSLDQFRTDLSRLLASPDPSQANAPLQSSANAAKRPPPETRDQPSPAIASRLGAWFQQALAIAAVSLGLGLVGWTEWRWARRRAN